MLSRLKIENIAIIELADISFSDGFNVMTGETGAGKSIIIDSINAVTGERTSKELIRTGAQSGKVTAVFENVGQKVIKKLEDLKTEKQAELSKKRKDTIVYAELQNQIVNIDKKIEIANERIRRLKGRKFTKQILREKAIAAHRSGLKTIVIPKENARDIDEIPETVQKELEIITATTIDDVLNVALV